MRYSSGSSALHLALLTAFVCCNSAEGKADQPLSYNRDVRPILSDKCFYCHGPDSEHREADLRLDEEASAKDYAIVTGAPDESEFFLRIISEHKDERMPPPESGKTLSAEETKILRRWISEGAVYEKYWAFVSPKDPTTPDAQDADWARGPIDRFVQSRLQREGLSPSPDADRVTLARRLSLDLTGLPPSIESVNAFVSDSSPQAYAKYVDRLLASPAYGERMAMYWLDLVRYADTVGYHGDQDHNISPYRDYVIDAFNASMPLDQFAREQLAGDLLPDAGIQQQVASGYNRLLQTSHEGGLQAKEYLAIYAADRIRNFSTVWMGATVGCAQCHDHKYDPYTIKDFYSMVAFFADIDESQHFKVGTNSLPTKRPPEITLLSKTQQLRVDSLERELSDLQSRLSEVPAKIKDKPLREAKAKELKAKIKQVEASVNATYKLGRKTMVTATVKPREIRVLPRGNWLDDSGPIVSPAIPEFMGQISASGSRANRLDLANWLHDRDNGIGGLTARVMANRIWYLLFGVGISSSLDDFGGQGQPPDNPELLDHLASELLRSDWDVKRLILEIVNSRTYQQTSVASSDLRSRDPQNQLFARQTSHRLPAETIRDTALVVSGLLVNELGGNSVKPYQPAGYYQHLNFPVRRYQHHTDTRQWRRGVYVHWQRQFLHPMMKAFDAPSREECTASRPRSNTPLAALALLNDPSFVEAAIEMANSCLDQGGDDATILQRAFGRALSRKPDATEQKILLSLLHANRNAFRLDSDATAQLVAGSNVPIRKNVDLTELASWTMVARAILNMDELVTRN